MTHRVPFIDWMKALGMFIIVFGHVAGGPIRLAMPPILPKQIGVVLFLFIMGFSLARETRPRWQVAFNRSFDMLLLGLIFALTSSLVLYLRMGNLAESNYLPLLLGANVVFDFFPSNPTTWYIGTYLHFILLWVLCLQKLHVQRWMLVVSFLLEIPLRALAMHGAGHFVAYMIVPNWITVFLLGMYLSQQSQDETSSAVVSSSSRGLWRWGTALGAMLVLWPLLLNRLPASGSLPFTPFVAERLVVSLLGTSAAISVLYLTYARLFYEVTRRLPDLPAVRFLAANTLIIFFAHMIVWNYLTTYMQVWIPSAWLRHPVNVLIHFVGLAVVSEWAMRWVPLKQIREEVGGYLFREFQEHADNGGWPTEVVMDKKAA